MPGLKSVRAAHDRYQAGWAGAEARALSRGGPPFPRWKARVLRLVLALSVVVAAIWQMWVPLTLLGVSFSISLVIVLRRRRALRRANRPLD